MREYVPTVLRPAEPKRRTEVTYAIGTEHGSHEVGFWVGPHPDEHEMLEIPGTSRKDCIWRFNEDRTEEVVWRWSGDSWVSLVSTDREDPTKNGSVEPIEVFNIEDARYTVIPSGFKRARLLVFEDCTYDPMVEYITDERYEWLKKEGEAR